MKKTIKHYNMDNLISQNCDFNIMFGERSNGKSYQLKHKRMILNYLKTGNRFILLRRFKEEITASNIEQYFQDVDVHSITDGKYNTISIWRKQIFLSNYNESGKIVRGEKIGYAVALSTEQNYAGGSFLDVSDIIFEEFMTRSVYLVNEPTKLMNFYCTVDRKRKTTKLWMCGNTISRVCPYIYEWNLHAIISKQKQGSIERIDIPSSDDDVVTLAIEYCESTGSSSHTIGFTKDMMNDGSWQSSPQPKLPKSKKEYNILFRVGFMYQSFKFLGELLQDKEEKNKICWYIFPYEDEFNKKTLVITDKVMMENNYKRNIYDLTNVSDNIKALFNNTFREENIFYATDLCGSDFKQVIDFSIRR